MEDYISRDAAVKIAQEYGFVRGNFEFSHTLHSAAADCIAIKIEGIPAADVEPVRRWIPCSERMPETNGEDASYLAYVPSFGAVDIADYHPDVDEWTFMCLPVTVTHWMPLPELPKEGGDGNGLD